MNKGELPGIKFLLFGVFWFCKTIASANGQADVCRMLEFIPLLDGHALVNHVIRNISLERQDACRVACYLDNDCLSYNFGRLTDGTSICQLSDSDHKQHPDDLKKSSGFIYHGTENACSKNLCSTHGKCKIDPKDNTYFCKCEDGFVGKYCEEECSDPLGIEHNDVPDAQITASTEVDAEHGASNGRLNFKAVGGKAGAWSAERHDAKQWLQVDLGQRTNVTGIETQGRQDREQWVTSYTVSYSDDNTTFTPYKQNAVLQGNSDRNTAVLNFLSPPINARYIRVHPKTWSGGISMRMELLGCPASVGNAFRFPRQGVRDYVIVNHGMPSLSALTACFWMRSADTVNSGTPLSYALSRQQHNEFVVYNYKSFYLYVGGVWRETSISANDGKWHHICTTWENTAGSWKLYKDGVVADQGQGLNEGYVIGGAGSLVLGQEQDSVGGSFNVRQSFIGEMTGVNIWSRVLDSNEITTMAQWSCTAGEGDVYNWSDFIRSRRKGVKLINASCRV